MLRTLLIVVMVIGMAAVAGCKKEEDSAGERMREEAREAAEATGEWAAETRQDLVETAEDRVASLKESIRELGERAAEKGGEVRQQWEDDIRPKLEQKLGQAEEQLAELKDSGGDAWKDLKAGVRQVVGDLQDAYEDAKARIQGE